MAEYANSQRKEIKLAKVTVNKYGIIILDGTVDGKRHRLTTGKKSDTRLLKWYKRNTDTEFFKLYEEKFGSKHNDSITFEEYGSMIVEITKGNRNKFSQDEEVRRFEILCKTFGKVNITDIKASDITKWQQQSSYAPRTILKFRSTMNSIFEMALSDDIILKNPLRFVKAPKKQHGNIRVFTEDEVKILIEQATGQLKNILMLAFFSGLRGSELIALRWNDIDFDAETIRIDSRIRQGDEDVPKSKRIRILDMLPQAKTALKKQWLLTGMKNDHVFLAQRNKPYVSHSNINEAIKKLCIDCGIEAGTLHVIRKTCNTLYKQYNLPLDWILDQIGHTDDDVNREHYTGRIKPDLSKIGRVLA